MHLSGLHLDVQTLVCVECVPHDIEIMKTKVGVLKCTSTIFLGTDYTDCTDEYDVNIH